MSRAPAISNVTHVSAPVGSTRYTRPFTAPSGASKAGAAPPCEPFWALFEGPSWLRAAVASGKTGDEEDDDDDDDEDDEDHHQVGIPSFVVQPPGMPPAARNGMVLGIVLAAVIMALVGGIVAFSLMMDTPARPTTPTRGRVSPRR